MLMKVMLQRCLLVLIILTGCHGNADEEKASRLIVFKDLPGHLSEEAVRFTITSSYQGSVEFVESNEFQIVVNVTADKEEAVHAVAYQYTQYQEGVLLQLFDKAVLEETNRTLVYIGLFIGVSTFLAFVGSLVFVIWWNKNKRPNIKLNHFISADSSSAPLLDSHQIAALQAAQASSSRIRKKKKRKPSRPQSSDDVSSEEDLLNNKSCSSPGPPKPSPPRPPRGILLKRMNGNNDTQSSPGKLPIQLEKSPLGGSVSSSIEPSVLTLRGIPESEIQDSKFKKKSCQYSPLINSDGSGSDIEKQVKMTINTGASRVKTPSRAIDSNDHTVRNGNGVYIPVATTSEELSSDSEQVKTLNKPLKETALHSVAGGMNVQDPPIIVESSVDGESVSSGTPRHQGALNTAFEKRSSFKLKKGSSSGPRLAGCGPGSSLESASSSRASSPHFTSSKPKMHLTAFNSPPGSEDRSSQDSPQSTDDNTSPRLSDEAYATMSSGSDISTLKNSSTSSGGSSGSVATVIAMGENAGRVVRLGSRPPLRSFNNVQESVDNSNQNSDPSGSPASVARRGPATSKLLAPKHVHLAMFGVVTILSLAINTASGLAAPSTDVPHAQIRDLDSNKCVNVTCPQSCDPNTGRCLCRRGFRLNRLNKCVDVNECSVEIEEPACGMNSRCHNTDGSFFCKCNHGYYLKGNKCESCDRPCKEGTWEQKPCLDGFTKVCVECTRECPPNYFIVKECTPKTDLHCAPCLPKCSSGEFEFTPCYGKKNRQCQAIKNLPTPQGSDNLIMENRGVANNPFAYVNCQNHSAGPVKQTIILHRDTGYFINVKIKEANLAPVVHPVNHSMDNENVIFYGEDEILSRYCPYPMPMQYRLNVLPHRLITSRAVYCSPEATDAICRTEVGHFVSVDEPCETYGVFGRMPKLNPKGWSVVCVRPGVLTELFDISHELTDVSPSFYDKTLRCAEKRNDCDTCYIKCAQNMQQTRGNNRCEITEEDADNGESPRLQYCYNCCAKNCSAQCNMYQSEECKPVRCAVGTVAEVILTPVFTNENSMFYCHMEMIPDLPMYDVEYSVYRKTPNGPRLVNNKVLHTRVTYNDKVPQLTAVKYNFLKITVSGSSKREMPDIIKGSTSTKKFTAGFYKNNGKEITKEQVTGRSINIKPKTPFGVSTRQWEKQNCDTDLLSNFVMRPRTETEAFKPDNNVNVLHLDKNRYVVYEKQKPHYLLFEVGSDESLLAPLYDPSSIRDNSSLRAELTRALHSWTIKLQGELTSCPGSFSVKIFDPLYEDNPIYVYDIGVSCPPKFELHFAIPTAGEDDYDKTFDVEMRDSYRKINLKVHRPAPKNITTYSFFRRILSSTTSTTVTTTTTTSTSTPTTEPSVNGTVTLDGLTQQHLQVFTPLVAVLCVIIGFLTVILIVGFLTSPDSVVRPDIEVQNYHLFFVVGYVTFRTAYALAVTFTVLLMVIKAVNSNSKPVLTLQQYSRYIESANTLQSLEITNLKKFVAEEIERQNVEANRTKFQCEQLLVNVHNIVEEIKRNLTLKGVRDMSAKSITKVASQYTENIVSTLSKRVTLYREEFSKYAKSMITRMTTDITNTFETISSNKWLVGAKYIHDSVYGKRQSKGKKTKPMMDWLGIQKDIGKLSADLTIASFPMPNMSDFIVPTVNHSKSRKAEAPTPANITIPENKWTFYQASHDNIVPSPSVAPSISIDDNQGKPLELGWTSIILSVLVVDLVWLIHRIAGTYHTARMILYGYPCYIDCRKYQDDVYHSMVRGRQQKTRRHETFLRKCLKFIKEANIKTMKTLFVPKVVAMATVCCIFYLSISAIDKLLTVQTLASIGYFDTMIAPVVAAHRLTKTRIKTNAYRINKFEFPFHEELFNVRLKRYQMILDLYSHMYRTNSLLQDVEYCNWRKKLDSKYDCNCTTVEKVSFDFKGCEFPPVSPIAYSRHNISSYKRDVSGAVLPYVNASRQLVQDTLQILLLFLAALVCADLVGAVFWIYLKRFNLLRVKTLYEVDRYADSSVER